MVFVTDNNIDFINFLEKEGFEKVLHHNLSVPALTYKKGELSFTYIHGRFHSDDKAEKFLKDNDIKYEEVIIPESGFES